MNAIVTVGYRLLKSKTMNRICLFYHEIRVNHGVGRTPLFFIIAKGNWETKIKIQKDVVFTNKN